MNAVRERFQRHVESAKARLGAIHPNAVIVLAVVLLIAIAVLNAVKIPMLAWGIGKMLVYAFVGDWIDRKIFPNDQPAALKGIEEGTAWKRKTFLIAAAILASGSLP